MNKPDEIKMSHDQISELIEGQKNLQKQFNAFAETQDQLVYKISGNPLDRKDRGMIGKLDDVVEDVDTMKDERKKMKWTFAGFVFAGSLFLAIVQVILKVIFNK
jgi:hypothetical protein